METMVEPVTALVQIESFSAVQLFSSGFIDPLLDKIKAECRAADSDISTELGRKTIASLAYKIARTKTFIDGQRIKLVADEKRRLAAIDAEGKRVREELDALKEEIRKPLTDWEDAEKSRIEGHENAVKAIESAGMLSPLSTTADIESAIQRAENLSERNFEEFSKRASQVRSRVLADLRMQLTLSIQADAERAELERLRREAAERAQAEREARIAEEAREKAEAEAREREEAAAKAAKEERDLIEREKAQAEARAAKAEADRKTAIERATQQAAELARKVEAERIAAREKAEAEKLEALEQERQKSESLKAQQEAEQRRRERDREHRSAINKEALAAFTAHGIPEEMGRLAVSAIAKKSIPHITINY